MTDRITKEQRSQGMKSIKAYYRTWIPDEIITWSVEILINQCFPVGPRYKSLWIFITRFIKKDRRYELFKYHVIIIRE